MTTYLKTKKNESFKIFVLYKLCIIKAYNLIK